MANKKSVKDEALGIVDAALAILNKYPSLDDTGGEVNASVNVSLNPFSFLMDLFKTTAGYDYLLDILSSFIALELPALEVAVKGILISNMRNIVSCSIDPIIDDKLLKEGVIFNLSQIDISDTLKYSPLSLNGKYYYFGCDNCKCADDVRDTAYNFDKKVQADSLSDTLFGTKDMNALIWYLKTRGIRREIWGRKTPLDENVNGKQRKKDGIITLEYNETPASIKNAQGIPMYIQNPVNDMIHVFIGNAYYTNPNQFASINQKNRDIVETQNSLKTLKETINFQIKTLQQKQSELKNEFLKANPDYVSIVNNGKDNGLIDYNTCDRSIEVLKKYLDHGEEIDSPTIEKVNNGITKLSNKINEALEKLTIVPDFEEPSNYNGISQLERALNSCVKSVRNAETTLITDSQEYQPIENNYYKGRTLMEFNYDYVMSLKLFDEKVVIAQLLDQITGCLSIDLNLSYKQKIIRDEIHKLVSTIIETDDAIVNDCFFTFSNDQYDAMLRKAELQRAGLFTTDGEENTVKKIDATDILNTLNGINENASQEKVQTIIKGSLTEVSGYVSSFNDSESESINFGAQMNFIEKLMTNLATVIANSVLSPKVYLLILTNLKLLGENTNFDLADFIAAFEKLIVSLIREIRDRLIEYLKEQIMKIITDIAKSISIKINLEQAKYYQRLIKSILDCFKKLKGKGRDFTIDDAVVDIYDTNVEIPSDNIC